MLCLVFAVAGPVMPGAGDVSPMDPTIAYGAAPTMLVFAPDTLTNSRVGSRDAMVLRELFLFLAKVNFV